MPKQFSKQRDIDVSLRLVVVTSIELKLVELNRALRGGITFKHARAPLHRSGHLLPPSAQATGQPGAEPGAQSLEVRLCTQSSRHFKLSYLDHTSQPHTSQRIGHAIG